MYLVDAWARHIWGVEFGKGSDESAFNVNSHKVRVPRRHDRPSNATRMHLGLIARESPDPPAKLSPYENRFFDAVEDFRIDALAAQDGIDTTARLNKHPWKHIPQSEAPQDLLPTYLQMRGTSADSASATKDQFAYYGVVEERLRDLLGDEKFQALDGALEELWADPTINRATSFFREWVQKPVKEDNRPEQEAKGAGKRGKPFENNGEPHGKYRVRVDGNFRPVVEASYDGVWTPDTDSTGRAREALKGDAGKEFAEEEEEYEQQQNDSEETGRGAGAHVSGDGRIRTPGRPRTDSRTFGGSGCEYHRHIHPARHSRAMRQPQGATDIGVEPSLFERLIEDQRIFRNRRPGGSIAIDCSGSMSWPFDELKRAISSFPSATIAKYQGIYRGDGAVGRLCVVAEDGRWDDDVEVSEDGFNGDNAVDIEALEWLASQRAPRVWLSDGGVCSGRVNEMGAEAGPYIRALSRKFNIVRIRRVPDAIKYLRSRGTTKNGVVKSDDPQFVPYM